MRLIYPLLLILAVMLNIFVTLAWWQTPAAEMLAAQLPAQKTPAGQTSVATTTVAQTDDPLELIGLLKSKAISESSGLARSHFLNDAWWTMNDSGHGNRVYLFGNRGQTLAICDLLNASNRDWEAMSSFQRNGKQFLMVADVGDNLSRREDCQLYVFEEPKIEPLPDQVVTRRLPARKFTFKYQDGPRNCEAVACQPDGSAVYLVEKILRGKSFRQRPGVYRLELPLDQPPTGVPEKENNGQAVLIAKRVAEFPFRGVTGMSISPDGTKMVIRNYLNAHLFFSAIDDGNDNSQSMSWETAIKSSQPIPVPLPLQVQAEAICFTSDGKHLIVTSELVRQSVWKVRIDAVPDPVLKTEPKK